MVPHSIHNQLARLRRRERFLTFVWGLACWVSVVLMMMLMCGFIDWVIDLQRDTPMRVRIGLFAVQIVVAAVAGLWLVVWPQLRRLPDSLLALWVESKWPFFQHRLISAVQLNDAGARLEGMSVELIHVVTREAEKASSKVGFARVADHSRLKWSGMLLAPVLFVAALPLLWWPGISLALLARQLLLPVEIPHSITLESISVEVWPIGDSIPIQYRVTGRFNEDTTGMLSVTPAGQPTDLYPLSWMENRTDPKTGEQYAVFGASINPSSVDIEYSARMADGRTRLPSVVRLVPRPVIQKNNKAWTLLPAYCGLRPNGERYEQPQGHGDVVGIPGSSVRVQFHTQTPVQEAWIQLLSLVKSEEKKNEEDAAAMEAPRGGPVWMKVSDDGLSVEGRFDLHPGITGYRMVVKDENGFENFPRPRRSLRLIPEDPPQVMLLRDTFGIGADFDVEGLPVILGERIRIPYVCFGPYGLSKAQVLYRVLKKHESGNEPVEEEPWIKLPLTEETDVGALDPKTGKFMKKRWNEQVAFHAVPSPNPDTILGRTSGGGRYFLHTKGLINQHGMAVELKSGDQIEYCVEVFASRRDPEASTPSARSETRVSTVLEERAFFAWLQQVGREDERLKLLRQKQEGVFEQK